jgi:hypothetical protein
VEKYDRSLWPVWMAFFEINPESVNIPRLSNETFFHETSPPTPTLQEKEPFWHKKIRGPNRPRLLKRGNTGMSYITSIAQKMDFKHGFIIFSYPAAKNWKSQVECIRFS